MRGAIAAVACVAWLTGCVATNRPDGGTNLSFVGLGGGAGPTQDDGFHSRLTAGCADKDACDALYRDSLDRLNRCVREQREDCGAMLADRDQARALRARRAEIDAKMRARVESTGKVSDEAAALNEWLKVSQAAGSSCEDVARLSAAAESSPFPNVAVRYRATADARRRDGARSAGAAVRNRIASVPALDESTDIERLTVQVTELPPLLQEFRCLDPDAAETVKPKAEAWLAALGSAAEKEKTCRATPSCMASRNAERLLEPLCTAVRNRRIGVDSMAHERQNPSGVVNLNALHEWGEMVQDADVDIRRLAPEYARAAKRPFAPSICDKKD